jgi:methyl-accepting chemotaxis protein
MLHAITMMRDSIAAIVGQVRSSAPIIATASSEIAAGNFDLSSSTEQQASSLEQTASFDERVFTQADGGPCHYNRPYLATHRWRRA